MRFKLILSALAALMFPYLAAAQGGGRAGGTPGSGKLENPLGPGNDSLICFLADIIDIVVIFAVPIIILMIIFAGFQYVVGRGNPEKIKKANLALLYAVIGGVIILGANLLIDVVADTVTQLGVDEVPRTSSCSS